jgi:hypothetical protein
LDAARLDEIADEDARRLYGKTKLADRRKLFDAFERLPVALAKPGDCPLLERLVDRRNNRAGLLIGH